VDLETDIDGLYGVPLDEFIAARDELAKRLNKEGDREAGARVKALRKPTVGAWALNQAVRRRRKETAALLATAERLQDAQDALLSGGDPSELRDATREERALTSAIADCAEAIASETGKSGSALRDRVRATLHAAALDEEARIELETGRFTREREAVGLGAFGAAGASASAPAPARSPARKPPAKTRERAAARPARAAKPAPKPAPKRAATPRADRAAAREAAAREARLAEAEGELAEAREAHEAAVAEHSAAFAALESARETLRETEVAERDARRVMREHEREAAKRERKVDRMRPKR
jgi:hypothetical protein